MPPQDPSTDLTEDDELYLKSCLDNYRHTGTKEKEAFRLSCVKHIIGKHGLDDSVFVTHFYHTVR